MANWVCRSFESLRALREAPRAAYYELINGRLLLNSAYRQVPEIRVAYHGEVPDQGSTKQKSMCELIEEPSLLEF
jgi:hypothetical protein